MVPLGMHCTWRRMTSCVLAALPLGLGGCGDDEGGNGDGGQDNDPMTDISEAPGAGNPDGGCDVPGPGMAIDVSEPKTVVGDGTPESCTSEAVVEAVAGGGIITFDCGPDPVRIALEQTAKVVNDATRVVIDGGGKVTLSGAGSRRILYMNTCDSEQKLTSVRCENQENPLLVVQNLTFVDGNTANERTDGGGGGAIFARGGRLRVLNSRFFSNRADFNGEAMAGGAIRAFDQFEDQDVLIVDSTFGAERIGNRGANGGALGGFGTSYRVINSLFLHNRATGEGGSMPKRDDTPGGGLGGAIFVDGDGYSLSLCGVRMEDNEAKEGAAAVFLRSADGSATLEIASSELRRNWVDEETTEGPADDLPGIIHQTDEMPVITDSVIEEGMMEEM